VNHSDTAPAPGRWSIARWIEVVAVVLPTAFFASLMFVFAAFAALGVLLAFFEHLRRGDPDWTSDLVVAAFLLGSSTGGAIGAVGLTLAVLVDADVLAKRRGQWRAVVAAMTIGLATAVGLLVTGYWPRTDPWMSYPLYAASVVAAYRLPLLIVANAHASRAEGSG
jgi:MFS family permease